MSIIFNADYPGSGFVAAERRVQWHLGFAPGHGSVGIVETQLAGERPMRRMSDRSGSEIPQPDSPIEMAGATDTHAAIRNLLAAHSEDAARDHPEVKRIEPFVPAERFDVAPAAREPEPVPLPTIAELAPMYPMPDSMIMSADEFLLH